YSSLVSGMYVRTERSVNAPPPPRRTSRDVPRPRAKLGEGGGGGARLILGSATPSLETLHLAATGKIARFELPARIGAWPLPPVQEQDDLFPAAGGSPGRVGERLGPRPAPGVRHPGRRPPIDHRDRRSRPSDAACRQPTGGSPPP